jgi:hypothetical protein
MMTIPVDGYNVHFNLVIQTGIERGVETMSKKGGNILQGLMHYTDNADYWSVLVEYTQYLPTKY